MAGATWLVDVGYVVKASEGQFKLDYIAAEQIIRKQFGSTQTYLFNGFDPAYGISSGLQAFYTAMQAQGMQVRLQPMESGPPGTNRQRRVDVDFSAHLVWQASLPEVTTLVLTTGDQDFVPAVELVRREFQKHVLLFSYEKMVNQDLIAAVNTWWQFDATQLARR
ncbi:MAG: NYN domain-containing protein [Chloroflexaceae bacterium]